MPPITKRHGANLPHWTSQNATYFITFRLADSLPQTILNAYKEERARLTAALAENSPLLTPGDTLRLQELHEEKIEKVLDAGTGKCWMKTPSIADAIQNALLFFHTHRYHLHAWAVMPNHVHALVQPYEQFELSAILHSWKSFTAKEANRLLQRTGNFWQTESWDHLIRNDADFQRCVQYILNNPTKAALSNWRWIGSNPHPTTVASASRR